MIDNKGLKWKNRMTIVAMAMGLAYLGAGLFGVLSTLFNLDLVLPLLTTSDIMTSFVLILVGAIVLVAPLRYLKGDEDGDSFLLVGSMMGLFICSVSVMALGSHALDFYLLNNEELVNWVLFQDIGPSMILGVPSIFVLYAIWRKISLETGIAARRDPIDP